MPRVNHVKKARRVQGSCGHCGKALAAGDPYRWIKFRHGGKRKRCTDEACRFRPSDLTQSKMSEVYAAQECAEDAVAQWGGLAIEELTSILQDCAESIREVAQEYEESADNMPENLQDSPVAEECREKASELESWADDVESADFDEPEEKCEECSGTGTKTVGCKTCDGTGGDEDVTCSECAGDGEIEKDCGCGADGDDHPDGDWVEEQRNKANEAVGNCPL